ncbi:MAG: hypothetical protein WBE21_13660 [Candidatus Acidiferrales bacterium]
MTAGKHNQRIVTESNLPPWAKSELRKLKRIMTKGDAQSRALARRSRELCAVFHGACPRLNSDLLGRVVGRLADSVFYGEVLSSKLSEMARIEGRSRRERIKSILLEIQEVVLDGQRRQVEGLRRDIPLMLKQLIAGERGKSKRP